MHKGSACFVQSCCSAAAAPRPQASRNPRGSRCSSLAAANVSVAVASRPSTSLLLMWQHVGSDIAVKCTSLIVNSTEQAQKYKNNIEHFCFQKQTILPTLLCQPAVGASQPRQGCNQRSQGAPVKQARIVMCIFN